MVELEKVKELEEYLRNNEEGLLRYQYKLGYKEEQIEEHKEDLPTLLLPTKANSGTPSSKIFLTLTTLVLYTALIIFIV